jgi:ribosomal protein S18 acetylase RimI-like enzyme
METKKITQQNIRIKPMLLSNIHEVSMLHCACIQDTVPTKLGPVFLDSIYRSLLSDVNVSCLVATTSNNKIIGVITATSDLKQTLALQQHQIIQISLVVQILKYIISGKIHIMDILKRTRFESFLTHIAQRPYATILTLFVDSKYREKGIGRLLIQSIQKKLKNAIQELHVDTRINDKKIISFYQKNGFTPVSQNDEYIIMTNHSVK